MDQQKPLVYEILQGLIAKGSTIRVNLQAFHHGRVEGTLVKLVPINESHIRIHYDRIDLETTPPPLDFTINELENHSALKKIDVGYQLTINHGPEK